jgi:hypothetical protein
VAWRRSAPEGGGGGRVVAVNMGTDPVTLDVAGRVLVSSDGSGEGAPFGGTLAGDSAVLLEG